jgi:DNA-binding MarR family transcriptional regulator
MTKAQEIDHIHNILAYLLKEEPSLIYLFDDLGLGFNDHEAEILLKRLEYEGLIEQSSNSRSYGITVLSPKGRDIAQAPGGYKGVLQAEQDEKQRQQIEAWQAQQAQLEQQQQQREQLGLTRTSTDASVRSADASVVSAKWARRSGWIAGISLVVAIIALVISALFAVDINATNSRVHTLELRVRELQHRQMLRSTLAPVSSQPQKGAATKPISPR